VEVLVEKHYVDSQFKWEMESTSSIGRRNELLEEGWEPYAATEVHTADSPLMWFRRKYVEAPSS